MSVASRRSRPRRKGRGSLVCLQADSGEPIDATEETEAVDEYWKNTGRPTAADELGQFDRPKRKVKAELEQPRASPILQRLQQQQ